MQSRQSRVVTTPLCVISISLLAYHKCTPSTLGRKCVPVITCKHIFSACRWNGWKMRSPLTLNRMRTSTPGLTITWSSGRPGSQIQGITPVWQPTSWPRGGACQQLWWFTVRPAQRLGRAREGKTQRRRELCTVLKSLVQELRGPWVIHHSAVLLTPLSGEKTFQTLLMCLLLHSVLGCCETVSGIFNLSLSLFEIIKRWVLSPPWCLYFENIIVGNFTSPPLPNSDAHHTHIFADIPTVLSSPTRWNAPKRNIVVCWWSQALY